MRSISVKAALSALLLMLGLVLAACGDQGKSHQASPVPMFATGGANQVPTGETPSDDGSDFEDSDSDSDFDDSDGGDSTAPGVGGDSDDGASPSIPPPSTTTPTVPPPSTSPSTPSAPPSSSDDLDELRERAKDRCEQSVERARDAGGDEAAERVQRICDQID